MADRNLQIVSSPEAGGKAIYCVTHTEEKVGKACNMVKSLKAVRGWKTINCLNLRAIHFIDDRPCNFTAKIQFSLSNLHMPNVFILWGEMLLSHFQECSSTL